MSSEYTASSEDWRLQQECFLCSVYSRCLLELRSRIEILEATQHAHIESETRLDDVQPGRFAPPRRNPCIFEKLRAIYNMGREHGAAQPCPHIRSSDEGTSYCALAEQAAPAVEEPPAAAPAGSLVERVADALDGGTGLQARAAIREIAQWLRSEYPKRNGCGTAWANLLEQEASR